MAYQIYRIGEWERVGGVNGYSTIRACLQPGLYETEAYARKKAARSPTRIMRTAATEAFRSLRSAKARSTTTDRRSPPGWRPIRTSSISTTAHSEETCHDPENRGCPLAPSHGHSSERARSGATSILGRGRPARNRQGSQHQAERSPPDPRPPARARLRAPDAVSQSQGRPPCATVLICRP
jgi:hypothetical protein